MTDSIFSKIIKREIPAHFVYEDGVCVAILDKFPSIEGQTLVIPKEEVNYAFELNEDTYLHLFSVAKKMARALDQVLDTERTCLVVEGFEVPHMHIKLYPMPKGSTKLAAALTAGTEASDENQTLLAEKIKTTLGTV